MKLLCGLYFTVLLSGVLLAQRIEENDLSIGAGVSCHASLFENYGVDSLYKVIVKEMQDEETFRLVFAFQVPLSWQFSRFFSLNTGIQLYQYGYRTVIKDEILRHDTIVSHNDTASFLYYNSIYFLDLPAVFGFNFYNIKKWSFYAEAGFSGCFFLFSHNKARADYSDGRTVRTASFGRTNYYKEYFLTCNAGMGTRYALSKRIFLNLSANYKRFIFLFPLDNEIHQIKRVPFTIGFNLAVTYRI